MATETDVSTFQDVASARITAQSDGDVLIGVTDLYDDDRGLWFTHQGVRLFAPWSTIRLIEIEEVRPPRSA